MKKNPYLKISLLTVAFIFSSCGSNNNYDTNKKSVIQKINTGMMNTIQTSETGIVNPKYTSTPYSTGTQSILKLQVKKGRDAILQIDCNTYDSGGKAYCEAEKIKLNEWKNEITWESVLKKGDAYIKSFDCSKISSGIGKGYCEQYKTSMNTSSSGSLTVPIAKNRHSK